MTEAPGAAEAGTTFVIAGSTVKGTPLLGTPETVTYTLPELAPAGTGTWIAVSLQLVGLAVTPLKLTVLVC